MAMFRSNQRITLTKLVYDVEEILSIYVKRWTHNY